MKSLKSGVYFTLTTYFNLDDKISSEILNLYLDFLKFTIKNIDLYIQVVPNILKSFLITKLSINLELLF